MSTTNSTRIECPPTLPSVEQHANNTHFLPVHTIPENPDCFSTLKRGSDSQEVNSFCVRKEKRYCDCPQLDCKHRFYHKSMLEVRTVSSLRTIGSSLALLREYYQRSGNDPSIHPLFQLNTLLFDTIMDYAKCMSCVSVRWSSPCYRWKQEALYQQLPTEWRNHRVYLQTKLQKWIHQPLHTRMFHIRFSFH